MHLSTLKIPVAIASVALASFGMLCSALATPDPASVGGLDNTADGFQALRNVTSGQGNTAIGFDALLDETSGNDNTAVGAGALTSGNADNNTAVGAAALGNNGSGAQNTAVGEEALHNNISGGNNTATGYQALFNNTTSNNVSGSSNTANGYAALFSNTTASTNTATGFEALFSNLTGPINTATGAYALFSNTTGQGNVATGVDALYHNQTGHDNTADGYLALSNSKGSSNTALGSNAGLNLTTGSNNIDIGANVVGNAGEANTIRIGKQGTQKSAFIAGIFGTAASGSTVVVTSTGKLGVATSSARFKEQIEPMEKTSEAIEALRPVTFRYKPEIDGEGVPQFGLVAEEVEKVNPDLVIHDDNGKPFTVRYEAVNAMLLNEFLKEHRKVEEQQAKVAKEESTIAELKRIVAQQQKQIETVAVGLQKVSAAVELNIRAPTQVVDNR